MILKRISNKKHPLGCGNRRIQDFLDRKIDQNMTKMAFDES